MSARPTRTTLRLPSRGRSPSVERALTDFGEEESFERAAKRFEEHVDYEKARASGYPTGSCEVESAHRYLPQKRLKIAGACWSPATINPMLALRVVRENIWWDDYWATA